MRALRKEETVLTGRALLRLCKHDDVNMPGWFQKLLKLRASSTQQEQEAKVTKTFTTPSEPSQSQSALNSAQRWSRLYDVFVCHSSTDSDSQEAGRLVSFLEASPLSLRCFLRQRDDCPGGAVSTELCEAVQNSHVWALLITPDFLQDGWCKYMMHQALAEGSMSSRIIPLIHNLSRSEYPQELRFYYYIDLSRNPDRSYTLLSKTVLKYMEDLVKSERIHNDKVASSSNGEDSSKNTS